MIRLEHIHKSFGAIPALQDITLEIPAGAVTILAGADGAGKSTLFKSIVGLVRPDSGTIHLGDTPLGRDRSILTRVTGYMPERFSLYTDLSVEENMNFFADIQQVPRQRREELKIRLLEKTGMLPFRNRRAGALSGGMKQKLALSAILLASPQLIILDEPTTGVDPLSRIEFFAIIDDLKREGKTILIATPYLDEAEKGDYIVFIKGGRILRQQSIDELRATFPARLFRIEPQGNLFDLLEELRRDPQLRDDVYIRGQYLKYLQSGPRSALERIPHRSAVEEQPRLEDIYLFYERHEEAGRE